MEYTILVSNEADKLERLVEMHFSLGWRLQGGVAIAWKLYDAPKYAQAMVRGEANA